MRTILTVILLSSLSFIACKKNKTITKTVNQETVNYIIGNNDSIASIHIDSEYKRPENLNAKYKISKVKLDNQTLIISVSYSGGCQDQTFELVSNGKVEDEKMYLDLVHDNKNDMCKKMIMRDLKFDLSSLGANEGNVNLILNLYRGVIVY